jgi:dephospho-CoA kinase
MHKTIITIVGEKLAGKDSAAAYLEKKYSAQHLKFSQPLDEILTILDLEKSRRNEIDLGLALRSAFGKSILGPALAKRAQESKAPVVVISGLRMDELKDFEKLDPVMIYITAPARVRFDRYLKRKEKTDDGQMDFENFLLQEKELTELDIPTLGKQARFKIENIGTLEELNAKLNGILSSIGI